MAQVAVRARTHCTRAAAVCAHRVAAWRLAARPGFLSVWSDRLIFFCSFLLLICASMTMHTHTCSPYSVARTMLLTFSISVLRSSAMTNGHRGTDDQTRPARSQWAVRRCCCSCPRLLEAVARRRRSCGCERLQSDEQQTSECASETWASGGDATAPSCAAGGNSGRPLTATRSSARLHTATACHRTARHRTGPHALTPDARGAGRSARRTRASLPTNRTARLGDAAAPPVSVIQASNSGARLDVSVRGVGLRQKS